MADKRGLIQRLSDQVLTYTDFLTCCLLSNHAHLVVVFRQNHLSRKLSCSGACKFRW
jgi:hypothetical protein